MYVYLGKQAAAAEVSSSASVTRGGDVLMKATSNNFTVVSCNTNVLVKLSQLLGITQCAIMRVFFVPHSTDRMDFPGCDCDVTSIDFA